LPRFPPPFLPLQSIHTQPRSSFPTRYEIGVCLSLKIISDGSYPRCLRKISPLTLLPPYLFYLSLVTYTVFFFYRFVLRLLPSLDGFFSPLSFFPMPVSVARPGFMFFEYNLYNQKFTRSGLLSSSLFASTCSTCFLLSFPLLALPAGFLGRSEYLFLPCWP